MNKKGTVFGFSPLNIGLILIAGIVLGVGVTVIVMQKKQEKSVV